MYATIEWVYYFQLLNFNFSAILLSNAVNVKICIHISKRSSNFSMHFKNRKMPETKKFENSSSKDSRLSTEDSIALLQISSSHTMILTRAFLSCTHSHLPWCRNSNSCLNCILDQMKGLFFSGWFSKFASLGTSQ